MKSILHYSKGGEQGEGRHKQVGNRGHSIYLVLSQARHTHHLHRGLRTWTQAHQAQTFLSFLTILWHFPEGVPCTSHPVLLL